MKGSNFNKIIKKMALLTIRRMFLIRFKSRTYLVSGFRNGKITFFENDIYFFEESECKMEFGWWSTVDGAILIFDHYVQTMNGGKTFYSYKLKLELIKGSWDKQFTNSPPQIYDPAREIFCDVEKLDSRENQMLMRLPANGVIAEIGVEAGVFSKIILSKNSPAKLHLIDRWESLSNPWPSYEEQLKNYNHLIKYFEKDIESGRIVIHKGDDMEILAQFPDEYFDWVYIDTTHQYEQTLRELYICSRKAKNHGYICGHEYYDNSISRRYGFGLIRAVNQFVWETDWTFKYLTLEPMSSFVLER